MTKAIFRTATLAVASLATVLAAPALAGTVTASGTQSRGVAGRNAELKGQAVSLPATCTISSVSGQNAGFWLQGSRTITFNDMASAKGRSIPAGTYNVYPNLKPGAGTASVQVTFSCP